MHSRRLAVLLLLLALPGCAKQLDVQLPEAKPETKVTAYSDALRRFGVLTELFHASELYVQVEKFQDDTGTAQLSQGDIPLDVTEMVNSAVNRIGGAIRPVAYRAQYMSNQLQLMKRVIDEMLPLIAITTPRKLKRRERLERLRWWLPWLLGGMFLLGAAVVRLAVALGWLG